MFLELLHCLFTIFLELIRDWSRGMTKRICISSINLMFHKIGSANVEVMLRKAVAVFDQQLGDGY